MNEKPTDRFDHRIDEELVCVDALMQVLYTYCSCKDVRSHREQQDPPDFTVMVDGEQFPTEVTSIVSHQQYHAHCDELAEAIRDKAISKGVLAGTYALIVSRLPTVPKQASRSGRKLLDDAVAYIEATEKETVSSELDLATAENGRINIAKVSEDGAEVGVLWAPSAMWKVEAQSQLSELIQEAIDKKRYKLKNIGISSGKALLLLYDAYGYGEPKDAVEAMQQVKGFDWFHSIFWAASFSDRKNMTYPEEPGRGGLFLFSQNPDWSGQNTIILGKGT